MASGSEPDQTKCSSATGTTCPSITELEDGDFEVIGETWPFPAVAKNFNTVAPNESVVHVPRDVMLSFLGDFSEKVLALRMQAINEGLAKAMPLIPLEGEE